MKVLTLALKMEDEQFKTVLLKALAPFLAELPTDKLYVLWRNMFKVLVHCDRKNLLADIIALIPVIIAIGGDKAIIETFFAIQDIGRWWP